MIELAGPAISRFAVCLISECALSRKHGTGAQLLQLFDGAPIDFFHFYLTSDYGGLSEINRSFLLEDPRYRGRGRRFVAPLERAIGLNWWRGDEIRADRFGAMLKSRALDCDVVHLVIGHEAFARRALSILRALRQPYVLHVMDLYETDGLSLAKTPNMVKIVEGAARFIAISEPIAAELRKWSGREVQIIPTVHSDTRSVAKLLSNKECRILVMGKLYELGIRLLEEAWDDIKRCIPGIQLVYIGQHSQSIPRGLAADVCNLGYISDTDQLERAIVSCQIAYLPGPSEPDHFTRFSIPSRTADYLMLGLPVIAAVPPSSATGQFLSPLSPKAVRMVDTPAAIVDSVVAFGQDQLAWENASISASDFARKFLSIGAARSTLVECLRGACAIEPAMESRISATK